jgi:hypothetical protein
MSSERLWVLILVLVTFLAGFAGGLLYAERLAPAQERGPYADYVASMRSAFDLSPEATRDLRYLMASYHRDVEDLKARHVRDMDPELVRLGQVCRERIEKYVLPAERREEFRRLAAGLSAFPATP